MNSEFEAQGTSRPGGPSAGQVSGGLAAALLVLLALAVYWPGTEGDFAFDDYKTLVRNDALDVERLAPGPLLDAAFSEKTGPLWRPVAMLSFAANRSLAGPDARSFKLTNLALHALNGVLLYALLLRLLPSLSPADATRPGRAAALAWLVTAVWVVHPLNLTTVLYVVQRMTLLWGTWMLIAMLAYAELRTRRPLTRGTELGLWVLVAVAFTAALLTKEVALLLPVYLFAMEATAFRYRDAPRLRALWRAGVVAALTALAAIAAFAPEIVIGGYVGRDFTLVERVLTECRVLVRYIAWLLWPDPSALGLFHDDIALSQGWLRPPTTLGAALLLAALGVAAWLGWRSWFTLGVAWFLGGHLLESTVYPLEIAHEHRNYLPGIGLVLALVLGGAEVLRTRGAAHVAPVLAGALLLVLGAVTWERATTWSDPVRLAVAEARHHPRSARAVYELGRIQLEQAAATGDPALREAGLESMARSAALARTPTLPLAALLNAAADAGDDVRVAALVERLAALPHQAERELAFRIVVACQAWRGCRAAPDAVLALAGALLGDRTLSPRGERRVAEWLAMYYLRVLGDAEAALDILDRLVTEAPEDLRLGTRYAEALAAAGRTSDAAARARALRAVLPATSVIADRALRARLARLVTDGE